MTASDDREVQIVPGVVGPRRITGPGDEDRRGGVFTHSPPSGVTITARIEWSERQARYVCTSWGIAVDPEQSPALDRITTAVVRQHIDQREFSVDSLTRAAVQIGFATGQIHEQGERPDADEVAWGLAPPDLTRERGNTPRRLAWVKHLHDLGAALYATPTAFVVQWTGLPRPTVSRLLAAANLRTEEEGGTQE